MKNSKKKGVTPPKMANRSEAVIRKGDGGSWRGTYRRPGLGAGAAGWIGGCSLILTALTGCGAFAQSPPGELTSGEAAPQSAEVMPQALSRSAPRVQTGPSGRLQRETASRRDSEEELPYHLHFLWESRYVSEGRDNLSGGGLASVASEIDFGLLTFSPWYARGYDSDYDELSLNFILGFKPNENIELYAGYAHLQFFRDGLHDNEIGAGIVLTYLDWADFFATGTYSFDAGGSFIETGLSREFVLFDRLTLKAIGLLGINAGYIADGHDGANNLQLSVEASYKINRRWDFTLFAGYSLAIGEEPGRYAGDETLYDFFWSGAGMIVHF